VRESERRDLVGELDVRQVRGVDDLEPRARDPLGDPLGVRRRGRGARLLVV